MNRGCLNPSPYVIPFDKVLTCSFLSTDIRTWFSNVEQHATEGVNKILIGNKCDWEEKRAVSTEQGQALANELGIPFMEVSAKSNINVEKAFFSLASSNNSRPSTSMVVSQLAARARTAVKKESKHCRHNNPHTQALQYCPGSKTASDDEQQCTILPAGLPFKQTLLEGRTGAIHKYLLLHKATTVTAFPR